MKPLTADEVNSLLIAASIKPKLRQELRFAPDKLHWESPELIAISNRADHKGVLFCVLEGSNYIVPYELSKRITTSTGQGRPIICDFCMTWQPGMNAARITFTLSKARSRTFLCCGDLLCSLHVRTQTQAARTSRAQLREDLSMEARIQRLIRHLQELMRVLQVVPVSPQSTHLFSD